MQNKTMKSDIGIIGLGVMGANLALNMEDKGYKVSIYNRTPRKLEAFLKGREKKNNFIACRSLEELVDSLKSPKKIMLMIKAGEPVNLILDSLIPLLDRNDIIIDGGNSKYEDTKKRIDLCSEKGVHLLGVGISGGAEGALNGPSIMVGGPPEAWPNVKEILQSIAAKTEDSMPCCEWLGLDGAGHFIKMVHNGLEYGEMQLISEAFHLMQALLKLSIPEIQTVFEEWKQGELKSYLIEITSQILKQNDEDGSPLIDKILDTAEQKGTGKWAGEAALEHGVPLGTITESVFARFVSSLKDERLTASKILPEPEIRCPKDKSAFINNIKDALYAAKIILYSQGFTLMQAASKEYNWSLNYSNIAQVWSKGCIIKSELLKNIKETFDKTTTPANLMLTPVFSKKIRLFQNKLRNVVTEAISNGMPVPAASAAIAFLDQYRSERLPANLIQAQRDYFGAHMYEKIDKPRGKFFHTKWTLY